MNKSYATAPPPGFVPPPPYSEAPPSYNPGPANIVIIQNRIGVGPEPQSMTCPHCQLNIVTRVIPEPTVKTHLAAVLLCFIFMPAACCVYCIDSCLAKKHYCPHCNSFLGSYNN